MEFFYLHTKADKHISRHISGLEQGSHELEILFHGMESPGFFFT